MRREVRARWLAAATALAVVALAALFAGLRNMPIASAPARVPAALEDAHDATARQVFERLGCAACHAIGGVGNPLRPLDGVGRRRDAVALRDWAIGAGEARNLLPPAIVRIKVQVADDPELSVLIDYLARLR